jgi:hypothetical protein
MGRFSYLKTRFGHSKNMLLLKPKIDNMLFALTPWDKIESLPQKKLIMH